MHLLVPHFEALLFFNNSLSFHFLLELFQTLCHEREAKKMERERQKCRQKGRHILFCLFGDISKVPFFKDVLPMNELAIFIVTMIQYPHDFCPNSGVF